MSTLQAAGNLLTIAGLMVAIGAVTWEAKSRHLMVVNRAALVRWLPRFLHLPRHGRIHTGSGSAIAAGGTITASGLRQHTIDPEAPVAEQIATLQENLDRTRDHVLEVMRDQRQQDRERNEKRLVEHDEQLHELREDHERTLATERHIATGVARWEFAGLILALVGALLVALGSLT